jgi:hypothetical protein
VLTGTPDRRLYSPRVSPLARNSSTTLLISSLLRRILMPLSKQLRFGTSTRVTQTLTVLVTCAGRSGTAIAVHPPLQCQRDVQPDHRFPLVGLLALRSSTFLTYNRTHGLIHEGANVSGVNSNATDPRPAARIGPRRDIIGCDPACTGQAKLF